MPVICQHFLNSLYYLSHHFSFKIQKYLAREREGFSLVELIIVIAIMAILIGVIALAVIPNIQRSRESKDLTTLDNIMSACNVAAANAQMKAGEKAEVTYASSNGALTFGSGTFFPTTFFDQFFNVESGTGSNPFS